MKITKHLFPLLLPACGLVGTAHAQVDSSILDPWHAGVAEGFSGKITFEGDLGLALPDGDSTTGAFYSADAGSSWSSLPLPSNSEAWRLKAFGWNGQLFLYESIKAAGDPVLSIYRLDPAVPLWVEVKALPSAAALSVSNLSIYSFEGSWLAIEAYQDYALHKREIYRAMTPTSWRKLATTSYAPFGSGYGPSGQAYSNMHLHLYQDFIPHDVGLHGDLLLGTGFDPDVWDPNGSLPPPFPFGQYPMSKAWTRDGIHWGPIPLTEADESVDLNATDWPTGLLVHGPALASGNGLTYFGENRTRITDPRITGPALIKSEAVMVSSWNSRSRTWDVFELIEGAFQIRGSSVESPEARLAGVWLSGNKASYDLENWVELPVEAEGLVVRNDRFFDTRTGSYSPVITPWPLAQRRDPEWVEDRYYGWVHDKYYPWVYVYTFGEGLESGWFYIGWLWDNQAYIWSDLEQEWIWAERESWPRAWSFDRSDWIGGAP